MSASSPVAPASAASAAPPVVIPSEGGEAAAVEGSRAAPAVSLNVRNHFPLIASLDAERVSTEADGAPGFAYLDNAATTQKPACVLDALDSYYRTANANPHRSAHRLGRSATEAFEDARAAVARFIGADAPEVVFTSGTTHALNTVAFCFAAPRLRAGDEIAVTLLEHHSNLVPWQTVAKATGARVVYLVPDRQGCISDAEIDRVVGPKTRIVAATHVSNVLGCTAPVARIAQVAHAHGAVVVADCAQSAAHLPLDVRALGVDFAAFSGHKVYGPMGIGVLYGRRELLDGLPPLLRGGGMVDEVYEHGFTFKEGPERFEAGTQNVAGAVGLAAALRYVERVGFPAIRAHENALTRRLFDGLASLRSVKLYGPGPSGGCGTASAAGNAPADRCGIVAFNVRGLDAAETARALDRRGVAVRAGAHCAHPLIRHLGAGAVCRASLALYNNARDVDRFLEAVAAAPADAARALARPL